MGTEALQLANIKNSMNNLVRREEAALTVLCQKYSQDGAAFARQNHSWMNRTFATEKGLLGKVVRDTMIRARITYSHTHSLYLEYYYSGKWAVLPLVLRRFESEFLEDVRRISKHAVTSTYTPPEGAIAKK